MILNKIAEMKVIDLQNVAISVKRGHDSRIYTSWRLFSSDIELYEISEKTNTFAAELKFMLFCVCLCVKYIIAFSIGKYAQ